MKSFESWAGAKAGKREVRCLKAEAPARLFLRWGKRNALRLAVLLLAGWMMAGMVSGCRYSGERTLAPGKMAETGASGGEAPSARLDAKAPVREGEAALPEDWTPALIAVVTSDLHFSLNARYSVYPIMAHIPEIAEIMADRVIALRPDLFIMTGDNTNSGDPSEVTALMKILRRIQDAGIEVVVTTGNHDFDRGHIWEPYEALGTPTLKDEASFSFALDINGYRLLAMDDSSMENQVGGSFPASTLAWMKEAMNTENEVIFLSHHNVLPGGEESRGSTYNIQIPDLRDLLADGGVRLCLSGHRHTQEVLQYKSMYEIISAPLAASPHQYGILEMGDGFYRYRTEVLELGMDLLSEEAAGSGVQSENIAAAADFSGRRAFKKERIMTLFGKVMGCVADGTLADHRDEIREDPCYEDLLSAFADTNYGPWINDLLEKESLPGNRLTIAPEDT